MKSHLEAECALYRQDLHLLWNLFRFSSFSVTVHMNVNELLRLESLTLAVLQITCGKIPKVFLLCSCVLQNYWCKQPGNNPPPPPLPFLPVLPM